MKYFDVFRCQEGERAGNVDYLGKIYAASVEEAEDVARLMYGIDYSREHFSIELEDDDEAYTEAVLACRAARDAAYAETAEARFQAMASEPELLSSKEPPDGH